MTRPRRHGVAEGFTLIEVLISLAILAVGLTGSLVGLIAVGQNLRTSQTLSYRAVLLDASVQRWMLANKGLTSPVGGPGPLVALNAGHTYGSCSSGVCNSLAIGASPWIADPSTPVTGDISTGAYFTVTPNGGIVPLSGYAGTACGDSSLPAGSYCREVLVTTSPVPITSYSPLQNWTTSWSGLTYPTMLSGITLSNGAPPTLYTLWVRVAKTGDTPAQAYSFSTTFAPLP